MWIVCCSIPRFSVPDLFLSFSCETKPGKESLHLRLAYCSLAGASSGSGSGGGGGEGEGRGSN